ncbi:unnamed protein product [Tuber melanosporum]|uniref:(Perigord truffle) hypothetical protein n=1 Tax=Tuber melanosporum (strain Mel28) TaxID=656061 RepID=D5GPS6_TUBMM|nr:unnamed protein product [Tuber melanosporum]
MRLCVDYRALNSTIARHQGCMPQYTH